LTRSNSKCREIEQALSEQPAGALLSQALREHIRDCPECRRLTEASSSLENLPTPSSDLMDRVAESMRADLRPVRPLASPATYGLVIAAILLGAFGFATYSMQAYGWEEMGARETILILTALTLGAVACVRSLVKQMAPAGRYRVSPELLPSLVVGGLAIGTAALFGFEREDEFWASSWICLKIGFSIALPTAALVWLVLRKGVFLAPAFTGATAGVLAGLVGAAALEVHCPNLNAWHILLSHVGVAVCLGMAGGMIGFVAEMRSQVGSPRALSSG